MLIRHASETRRPSSPSRQARAWSTGLPAAPLGDERSQLHAVKAECGRFGVDLARSSRPPWTPGCHYGTCRSPPATPTRARPPDEWIATDGQDHALAAVENLRNAVNDGAVPVLRDDASLRAYWDSRRRQTA